MSDKIPEDINTEACNDKPKIVIRRAITSKYQVGDRVWLWSSEARQSVQIVKVIFTNDNEVEYEVKQNIFWRNRYLDNNIVKEKFITTCYQKFSPELIETLNKLFLIAENSSFEYEDIIFNDTFCAKNIRNHLIAVPNDSANGFRFCNKNIKSSGDVPYGSFVLKSKNHTTVPVYFNNITDFDLQKFRNGAAESAISKSVRDHLNIENDTLCEKLTKEAKLFEKQKEQQITREKLELICLNSSIGSTVIINEDFFQAYVKKCLTLDPGSLEFYCCGKIIEPTKSLGIGLFQIVDSYNSTPISESMSFDNLTEANLRKLRRGKFESNRSKELRKLLKIEEISPPPEPEPKLADNCFTSSPIIGGEGLYVYCKNANPCGTTIGSSSDQYPGFASVNVNGDIYQLLTNADGTVKSTLAESAAGIASSAGSVSLTNPVNENTASKFEGVIWNDQISNIIFPDIELPVIDKFVETYEKVQASLREGLKSFIGAPINEETKKLMTDRIKKSFNEVVSGAYKQSLINILRLEYPFATKTIYVNSDDYSELQLPATCNVIEDSGRKLIIVKHPDIPSGFMYIAGPNLKQGEYPTLDKIRKTFGELYFVLNKDMSPNHTLDAFENAYREQKMNKVEKSSAADTSMTLANYSIKLNKNLDELIGTYKACQNILINSEDYAQLLKAGYNFNKNKNVSFIPCKEIVSGFVFVLDEFDIENVSNKETLNDYIRLNPVYLYCIGEDSPFKLSSEDGLRKYEADLVEIELKKVQNKRMDDKKIEYAKKYDLLFPELKQVNDVLTSNKFLEDGEVLSSRMGNDAYELMMTDIVNYTKSFKRNLPYSLRASVEGNALYSILNSIKDPMYHSIHFSTIFTFVDRLVEHKLLEEAKELMSIIKDLFRFHAGFSNKDPKDRIHCYFYNLKNNSQISSEMKSNSNREVEAEAQSVKKAFEQPKLKTMSDILHSFFTPIKSAEGFTISRVPTTQETLASDTSTPDTLTSVNLTESIENNMDKTSSVSETSTKKTLMQEGKEAFDVAKWRVAQRQAVRRFRDLLIVGLNQVGKDRSEVKALEKALKTKTGEGLISLCISFLSRMDMFAKHRNAEKFFTECRVEGLTVVSDEALEAFVGSAFPMIMGFISSSLDELPTVSVEVKQKPKKVRIHTAKKAVEAAKDSHSEENEAEEEMLASADGKQARKTGQKNSHC